MTTGTGCSLFDTPVGRCGISWSARGIRALQLPEADDRRTLTRMSRRAPQNDPDALHTPPPASVQAVIDRIAAMLDGGGDDLADIELDTDGVPPFALRVYTIARGIRPGGTITYGEIASRLGLDDHQAARDVGQALGANPFPIVVPCHRVVAAGGQMGGFSAGGGVATKRRLLALEQGQRSLFDL